MMSKKIKFEIDDTVRLKRRISYGMDITEGHEDNLTAKIESFMTGDGACMVDRDLCGRRFWDTEDFVLIKEQE